MVVNGYQGTKTERLARFLYLTVPFPVFNAIFKVLGRCTVRVQTLYNRYKYGYYIIIAAKYCYILHVCY